VSADNNEPMEELYAKGTWNLIGISKSDVPETLVGLLAENKKCKEVIEVIIETIACCSIYWPIANKFASMGVLKDLVLFIGENLDFRSSFVKTSIDAIWNIIEVGGSVVTQTMAQEAEVVYSLRGIFEKVLEEGYKLDDKALWNELCILINYVAACPESHWFFLDKEENNAESHSFLDVL